MLACLRSAQNISKAEFYKIGAYKHGFGISAQDAHALRTGLVSLRSSPLHVPLLGRVSVKLAVSALSAVECINRDEPTMCDHRSLKRGQIPMSLFSSGVVTHRSWKPN